MGMDISGFVECRAWPPREAKGETNVEGGGEGEGVAWRAAIDLFCLNTTRNYDAFGCLFGMRNYANFSPLAAERGLPVDVSETVRAELVRVAEWGDEVHGTTWITWAELKVVDWDEPAERADSRLHQYRQTPEGLRFVGKAAWDETFAQAVGPAAGVVGQPTEWPEGSEWLVGDTLYRAERIRRRDAVREDGEWAPVWTVMETLAALHGDDNVRLVVWFDI
ncbi:hypothetical protein [Embleya sp. AB8]|uniref:hypothetical protein n=1 Tax=Embleya sp. AB8 TaxID=3156304 RepID=UPI003C744E22